MERTRRTIWLAALLLIVFIAPQAAAEYSVSVSIKQTEGRWKDTLLAGETNILEISITNEGPVPAYAIPLNFSSESFGAFAHPDPVNFTYVNRMATPGNPFTLRLVNTDSIDGLPPNDRILYGAVEFDTNYLVIGEGVVIEQEVHVFPFVGSVRIDTLFFPPAGTYGFSDTLGQDIVGVLFHPSLPVFPVVLRNPNDGPTCGSPGDLDSPFGSTLNAIISGNDTEGDAITFDIFREQGTTDTLDLFDEIGAFLACYRLKSDASQAQGVPVDDRVLIAALPWRGHVVDGVLYFDDQNPAEPKYDLSSADEPVWPIRWLRDNWRLEGAIAEDELQEPSAAEVCP